MEGLSYVAVIVYIVDGWRGGSGREREGERVCLHHDYRLGAAVPLQSR